MAYDINAYSLYDYGHNLMWDDNNFYHLIDKMSLKT